MTTAPPESRDANNAQLKAGGNGVCPQQVAAAFRAYLTDEAGMTPTNPQRDPKERT